MQASAWVRLLVAAAVVALAGCAALPGNVERRESHAIAVTQATALGKVAAASAPAAAAGHSGSNTESMIVIDDTGLAAEAVAFLERGTTSGSYALRLDARGKRIEWVEGDGVLRAEPTPFGRPGLKPRLAPFFVSKELL